MKYTIAVGTTSLPKIKYLDKVIKTLGLQADLIPTQVESEISNQPLTSKETKKGSINRARNALKINSQADFSIGIEIGYLQNSQTDFLILCWSTIVDNHNFCVSCRSHSFLLPKFHQNILKQDKSLSDYVRQYLEIKKDSFSQIIGIDIRDREPFIVSSVRQVLLQYLNRKEF